MAPRVAATKENGVRVGKLRVQRTMRQDGLRGRGKRRFRVSTTDSNHALPISPNLLARNFTVAAANTVWVGDMTYIPTSQGWLYLAVVLDLFSRRIVGWSMGEAITAELACRALDMAWYSRSPGKDSGLIFHSDRGSQYASRCYADLLAGHGIEPSMSRKGNCWDNACSETLFGSLKVERLHGMEFQNHREAKDATLNWLLWYNGSRMHSTLNYLSPTQFEQQANARKLALAA
jgi:putative transposase